LTPSGQLQINGKVMSTITVMNSIAAVFGVEQLILGHDNGGKLNIIILI